LNAENGLDYILNVVCENPNLTYPRTISTHATQNRQVEIFSKDECLEYFAKSNYLDCRVSAFGRYEIEKEMPNLIFVDLDDKEALNEVLALFYKEIKGIPLVLNTGNGYCMIQPIQMISLTKTSMKKGDTKNIYDLPKKFLLFAERYLTNSKCDMGNHPSLKSCLIRTPGTFNSKLTTKGKHNESKVTVFSEWNKNRADIRNLPFRTYLKRMEAKQMKMQSRFSSKTHGEIQYIENILKSQLTDGRKRIFAMILCPYLMNIKKLTIQEAETKLIDYFDDYIPKQLIRYKLNEVVKKQVLPYSLRTMKDNDPELYNIIAELQVVAN